MNRLTRDGTAEPVSRDQILRHARGQGNDHFPCSADHEQDRQPYPVDPYSAICDDHTYIHTIGVYVLSSHLFWTSDLWTHQLGSHSRKVTQDFSTFFSAVLVFIFIARRIQRRRFPRSTVSRYSIFTF